MESYCDVTLVTMVSMDTVVRPDSFRLGSSASTGRVWSVLLYPDTSDTMLPKAVETFRFPSIYDDYDFCTRYGISRRAVPYFSFKEVSCPDPTCMTRLLSHELNLMISDLSSYLAENDFHDFHGQSVGTQSQICCKWYKSIHWQLPINYPIRFYTCCLHMPRQKSYCDLISFSVDH